MTKMRVTPECITASYLLGKSIEEADIRYFLSLGIVGSEDIPPQYPPKFDETLVDEIGVNLIKVEDSCLINLSPLKNKVGFLAKDFATGKEVLPKRFNELEEIFIKLLDVVGE